MTMVYNGLFIVLLSVLVPSLGSQPGPDELPDKLQDLLEQLEDAKADFQCVFDVTNEQCPCQTPGDCFESDLVALNSTLCDLINNLTALIGDQPEDCPPFEGCAALVTRLFSNGISVVDPVGTILPNIAENRTVGPLTVVGANTSDYSIYYISIGASGFTVNQLSLPSENNTEEFAIPTIGSIGTGIAYLDDQIFIATVNFLPSVTSLVSISCDSATILLNISCPGTVRSYDGRVYFGNCNEIQSINSTGDDLDTKVKFSMNIRSFDVVDQDNTVFCDETGALWIYNDATACFKLLECSVQCRDVKVNRCSSLVYVASSSVSDISIFNSTSCENEGTLTYITSTASSQPRLEFEPSCP